MEIWRLLATIATLVIAGLLLALARSQQARRELCRRVADQDAQLTALHRALHEQQAARSKLAHRAVHDPLTGLPNRTLLVERLDQALPEGALLLLDLDGFTDINDSLGQAAADALLVEVAQRLRSAVRHIDTVARVGGDEFAVVLPEASRQRAQISAVRIMDAVRHPFQIGGRMIRLTASLGMVTTENTPATLDATEALRDADLALSEARTGGCDRIVEFHPRFRSERLQRSQLVTGLRTAIDGDELTLEYQPIVALDTGHPVGLEALARWQTPGGDPIPPSEFIPVAEQTGLVVPLGSRVLRNACAQGRVWHDRYGVTISVNVSGRQLLEPDFADLVLAVLGDTGLPGAGLIIEITESVLVSADGPTGPGVASQLGKLRAHGVRVAIDDFGTGYSSLSYLHRLPVDIIKIDNEFVQALNRPPKEPDLRDGTLRPTILGKATSRRTGSGRAGTGGRGAGAGGRSGTGGRRGRVQGVRDRAAGRVDALAAPGSGSLLGDEAAGSPDEGDDRRARFANAVFQLSQSLHLPTVAEGVETDQQAEVLRAMGCPLAQGFWFAYPGDEEQVERYLSSHRQRMSA